MEQHCGDLLEEDLSGNNKYHSELISSLSSRSFVFADTCFSLPAGGMEIEGVDFEGKLTEGTDSMGTKAIRDVNDNRDDKALMSTAASDSEGVDFEGKLTEGTDSMQTKATRDVNDNRDDKALMSTAASDSEGVDFEGKLTEGTDSMQTKAIRDVNDNRDDKALMSTAASDSEGVEVGSGSSDGERKPEDEDKGAGQLFVSGDFRESDKQEVPVEGRINWEDLVSARDFETFDELFNNIAQGIERQMTVCQEESTQIDDSDASEASSTDEESEEGDFSSDVKVQWKTEGAAVEDDFCGYYKEVRTETHVSVDDPAVLSHPATDSDLERVAFDENRSGLGVKAERVEEGAAGLLVSPDWSDFKEGEGRPSTRETGGNPQVRNNEQRASDSASYFKSVLGCDGDETEVDEEKKQESATKAADDRHEGDGLAEGWEGLMADGDPNELKDFSGEDFQEAGEMYAELSFDFSPRVGAEEGCADACDVYLEMNTDKYMLSAEDKVEVTEGHSSSSSDYDIHVGSDKVSGYDKLNGEDVESPRLTSSHGDLTSAPSHNIVHVSYKHLLQSEEPLAPSDSFRTQYTAADMMDHLSCWTSSSTNQGSLDDSFFFNTGSEKSGKAELEKVDDNEEERNWEQEQERIKAFYKFYDDSDEDSERPGRMIKVQFSPEPLSQVIHYETDSSDGESLRGFSEDNDVDTDETVPEASALMDTKVQEQNPHQKTKFGGKHKCPNILRLLLRASVVVSVGLLALWFAIKHLGMLQPFSLF
ncbi:uncharacterized protein si:dkey-183p4.10 isoform X3 [Synchiropus splendidus]|uniref:uncharacterized protein si:dkey-183p4.10 isoform X3 n=1 Tax=Synchiropus splendidus TaxID=270530 RepID=UPI00237ECE45|nr:uncharacterized protein si:dkey-183p4.10 isoform X3 [Synchiropus splendidus]